MTKRCTIAEIAQFEGMTVFETHNLEPRVMRLLHLHSDNSWYVSDLSAEALVDAVKEL